MSDSAEYFQLSIPKNVTVEVPLNFDSESPGFTPLSEEQIKEVINFNIKSIILTSPGERFDSSFGVGLRNYLFESNLGGTTGIIQSKISDQISRYMPWLTSFKVEVRSAYDGMAINVNITYELRNPNIVEYFDLSVSLSSL